MFEFWKQFECTSKTILLLICTHEQKNILFCWSFHRLPSNYFVFQISPCLGGCSDVLKLLQVEGSIFRDWFLWHHLLVVDCYLSWNYRTTWLRYYCVCSCLSILFFTLCLPFLHPQFLVIEVIRVTCLLAIFITGWLSISLSTACCVTCCCVITSWIIGFHVLRQICHASSWL